ncbi:putative flavoprotein involved in K+ transport [Clavibacter sp. B3I6]|uniref:NAD(P)/FAD-dependent oxidoreductase n=1 Tax=Clavibacter sp. B3I6 TaxID=3042268 RepID=UPI002789EA07|nr:NAD(P)/FAD-dependent oxidoreductase [Clavibacter sp. B3I6]MDQ0745457.1 putative flavoprotein involved in K+ transport [Clavibacter sp. B3I6]
MPSSLPQILDALVIGAGPAGLGTALALDAVEGLRSGVVERGTVGETFRRWPARQRFLSPSFTGNGFGATDLNAVHPSTSPAFSLGVDYPTGPEYARYLAGVARHFPVPLMTGTEVTAVTPVDDGFHVDTTRGPVGARAVVWAGGEFHDPAPARFAGGQLADHSSTAAAWEPRTGRLVVVGGYESGIDIACHHVELGAEVTVVDPAHPWAPADGSDPSYRLAPRSVQRLASAVGTGRLALVGDARVVGIRPDGDGHRVQVSGATSLPSDSRPVLATGFGPGLGPVADLFDRRDDGWPLLTEDDESTLAPGLFLSGPAVRHGAVRFCFVYKFRQRYAHIARVIGERRGADCAGLEMWRAAGMLTDDLSCCGVECAC